MPWKAGGSHSQQSAHRLHTQTSERGLVFAIGGGDPKGHPSSFRGTGQQWGSLGEGARPGSALAGHIPLASPELHCTGNAEDTSCKPGVKTPGWHAKRPFFASKAS